MNNKTLAVAMTELKEQIINSINESNMPLYLVKYVLKEIYDDVIQVADAQIEKEIDQYKASQMQASNQEDIEEVEIEED